MWLVVTEVRSESLGLVTERHKDIDTFLPTGRPPSPQHHGIVFIVKCGITRFLCIMRVFEIRASSSSPRLPCVKFRFRCSLHCWASPWKKITYSINHSFTQLIRCPGNRNFRFGIWQHWDKILQYTYCARLCVHIKDNLCAPFAFQQYTLTSCLCKQKCQSIMYSVMVYGLTEKLHRFNNT